MQHKAVIFDLDGTLLDTLADIAGSVNRVLDERGLGTYPIEDYRHFVGEGVVRLFERALPEAARTAEMINGCVAAFLDDYRANWNVQTRAYLGVVELLDALVERSVLMAVLSNKPDEFTQCCVREIFSEYEFAAVIGQRSDLARKPSPAGALLIAESVGLAPREVIFLGDTATDMQTAVEAGMYPVGALWGFRPRDELETNGAKVVIAHPMELLTV